MLQMDAPNKEEWLTPEEAGKILHLSKWTVIRRCKAHLLPAQNFGSEKRERWFVSFKGLQDLHVEASAKMDEKRGPGIPLNMHPAETYLAPLLDSGKSKSRNNQ